MKGIVRDVNFETGTFLVDCGHDRYAMFHLARGGLPRGGEYVRWNDSAAPVTMVMGETSGTMLVDRMRYPITRAQALGGIEGVAR
jgi:hypothetical protein